MLGIYISGHPLEKLKEQIMHSTNINTMDLSALNDQTSTMNASTTNPSSDLNEVQMQNMVAKNKFVDGQKVKYAGIITSIKKKYTKNNKIMAFITIEDLYGTAEIIAFENTVINAGKSLIEENIVIVDGRLSIREDADATIIANEIKDLGEEKPKVVTFDITNFSEEQKDKLRNAIRYFSGDKNNMNVQVKIGDEIRTCGAIYYNEDIKVIFDDIMGC